MKKAIALTVIMGASLLLAQNKEVDSPDFALSGGNELIKLAEDNVLVFRENGTLKVTGSGYVEILAVGGGGGGGANRENHQDYQGGAGGGAGGVVHKKSYFLSAGEYPISIGAGGEIGSNGGNTEALGINAYGGGAGARYDGRGSSQVNGDAEKNYGRIGSSGGSGGGSTHAQLASLVGLPVSGGQAIYGDEGNLGHAGGVSTHSMAASGGGGAGGSGGDSKDSIPGCGGVGYQCDISGVPVYYAGGGAGFRNKQQIAGGAGGGGSCVKAADGQSSTSEAGVDGLGGGGCGGAKGGSGIFIVRYKVRFAEVFEGASGGTETRRNGRRIHTFTENGIFTMPVDGIVEVLLVGGGGGGGANRENHQDYQGGAGGGAGGVVHVKELLLRAGIYSLEIGAGGEIGLNGLNTEAFGRIAYGGGAGARYDGRGSSEVNGDAEKNYGRIGSSGGSGGGSTHARFDSVSGLPVSGGQAIYGNEGNLGHDGGVSTDSMAASGGGGAGGPGGNSNGSSPGVGGIGYSCDISGVSVYYAGGGAGFRTKKQIDGGLGGGGSCMKAADGQSSTPEAGVDGLGGGGCGGAKGGSGIVIVSYQTPPVPFRVIVK